MSSQTPVSTAGTRKPVTTGSVPARRARDSGLTLVELLIVITLMGLISTTLAGAMIVILRTAPSTELRIEDARSTRGLATWLSHDVASAPPFTPPVSGRGGFDTQPTADRCGAGDGANLVEMVWYEGTTWFASGYRLVPQGAGHSIRRVTCSASSSARSNNVTAGISDVGDARVVLILRANGTVEILRFQLTGRSGEQILVDTSSRNPSEFFPT